MITMKDKVANWSKQIEGIIGSFGVKDIPVHAYAKHTGMSEYDLIDRLVREGKKNATTFDIPMEKVAKYIREELSDERGRECFLYAILYNADVKHQMKVYHDIWTDEIIGHGYSKKNHDWKQGPKTCTDIGIYAKRDVHARFGFTILSVYPIFGEEED